MKTFKSFIALLLLFVLVFASCSRDSKEAGGKTLVIANTSGEPGNLHPFNTVSVGSSFSFLLIMETLVCNGLEGGFDPMLAKSWDVKDDGITFYLEQGVKFHDGTELKASDVVFTFQEIILNSTGGYAANLSAVNVNNVRAIDDYTVFVGFNQSDTTIMSHMPNIYIVPEKTYKEMGDRFQFQPIGTGPFKFNSWLVGDNITMERFNDYRLGTPIIETVIIRTIPEVSQAMIELETGGVHIIPSPAGSDVLRVLNNQVNGIKALTSNSAILRNNNININWLSEPLRDHRVREAIARAVDRELWVPIISPGVGSPAYSLVASGTWGWDPGTGYDYPYPYDLAKARQLLEEAGYGNGLRLILLTGTRDYHMRTVELLQFSLSQIGITLEVRTMELAPQRELMASGEGFDLYTLDNLTMSPGNFLSGIWRDAHPRFAEKNSSHFHFYTVNDAQGQRFSDLMDSIAITMDDNERLQQARELQKIFIEDLVWIPVNSIQQFALVTDRLQNAIMRATALFINEKTQLN